MSADHDLERPLVLMLNLPHGVRLSDEQTRALKQKLEEAQRRPKYRYPWLGRQNLSGQLAVRLPVSKKKRRRFPHLNFWVAAVDGLW